MIKSYDDLKAQRALAHNDLQLAKSKLSADTESWKEETKPIRMVGSIAQNLFTNRLVGKGKKGLVGNGLQLGLNAILAKTALKALPTPLNIILPHVIENVALNYTEKNGRDWLIKGLRWIKEVTEDDSEPEPTKLLLADNRVPTSFLPTPQENQDDQDIPPASS